MRFVVTIAGALVGAGVALQIALTIVSLAAKDGGNLAGDAGFFAAFLGLALVPLAFLLFALACIGRWLRAREEPAFFTRAIGASIAMIIVSLVVLIAGVGTLGGGIIPH